MTAKFSFVSVAALAVLPLPFACGGDDGPTHVTTHDAAVVNTVDAPPPCKALDSYTPATLADQGGVDFPAGSDTAHEIRFFGSLNADAVPDDMVLDLFAGYGAFSGSGVDIHTGDFTISGDETNFAKCGVCVLIAADDGADGAGQWYVAQSGVVKLTAVGTRLTGMLTNIVLASADTDAQGFPGAVNGTCSTKITAASFDGMVDPAGSATGKPTHVRLHSADRVLRHRYQ